MARPAASEDASVDAFSTWARTTAVPFPETAAAFDRLVKGSSIVAIGEPAHGAEQPLLVRNAIITGLVKRHGFTAVALETGITQARQVSSFIACGPGQAEQVARAGLSWGFGAFRENVALIAWLRAWNCNHGHRPVHFYGIDVQGGDEKGGMSRAPDAIDALAGALDRAGRAQAAAALRGFASGFTPEGYRALPGERQAALAARIDGAARALAAWRGPPVERRAAMDAVRAARQLVRLFAVWPETLPGQSLSPGFWQVTQARDAAMAENVAAAIDQEGPRVRLIVFAHDGHVSDAPLDSPPGVSYPTAPQSMGVHLRRMFGRRLRTIGILGDGSLADLPLRTLPEGSVEQALQDVALPPFFLPLAAAPAWAHHPQTINSNFIGSAHLVPATAFDALIFVGRLRKATPVAPAS